jgi:hypothetical protein
MQEICLHSTNYFAIVVNNFTRGVQVPGIRLTYKMKHGIEHFFLKIQINLNLRFFFVEAHFKAEIHQALLPNFFLF